MKTLILADVHLKVNDEGARTREEFVGFLRGIRSEEFERDQAIQRSLDGTIDRPHAAISQQLLELVPTINQVGKVLC